ncbi:Bug family tripartite tricarboxylate transporter substrate binding protein [Roseomonas populi]|nr:tripartite tricarboxylate transporter substrate binding protein [Roseomonas pecuniae]
MMHRRHLVTLPLLAASGAARAQAWPARPITVVVPYLAGGPSDVFGRVVAAPMLQRLGQPGVVENRAGANGGIAAGLVARAAADGHTLLVVAGGIMTINPLLTPNLSYDPVRDFAPVTIGIRAPNVLVVPATLPATSLDAFLDAAKSGGVTYGTPGIGSSEHLTMAMLAQRAGVEMTHVPYPGVAQTITDLLGGTLQSGFLGLGATLAHIRAGRLRPLAVSSAERSPALPEVPAAAERYPGFLAHSWQGLVAPRATPEPVLERLHALTAEALAAPEAWARLEALGFTVVASGRAEMAEVVAGETERWRGVIRDARITLG